jgi:hypothetical protein
MKIVKSNWKDKSDDESVYSDGFVEEMLESDELSSEEAGFMHGYDNEAG